MATFFLSLLGLLSAVNPTAVAMCSSDSSSNTRQQGYNAGHRQRRRAQPRAMAARAAAAERRRKPPRDAFSPCMCSISFSLSLKLDGGWSSVERNGSSSPWRRLWLATCSLSLSTVAAVTMSPSSCVVARRLDGGGGARR
ncbi:hypothetical protein S245_052901 [Arachis hypogaea]